jgi:hypothetical protein
LKVGSAILISTILGSLLGFGVSYFYFSTHLGILQTQVSKVNVKFYSLNSTVDSIKDAVLNIQEDLRSTQNELINEITNIDELNNTLTNYENIVSILEDYLTNLENELFEAQSDITSINSTLEENFSRKWYSVKRLSGSSDRYLGLQLSGEKIRIYWFMDGQSSSSIVDIKIYFSNGTLWESAGSSGVIGIYEKEMLLQEVGDYMLWIRVSDINLWQVEILEYY